MQRFEDIRIEAQNGIGMLVIDRGDGRNALRPHSLAEICQGLDLLTADDSVKVILIRAEGKHFSAGADFTFLDELTTLSPARISKQVYDHFQGAARRIYRCPKPTIALIQGAAVTVGCELALACDFRLAADDALFQESWIKLGIMPPLGGLFLLPKIVGLGRAKEMCLRAEAVKADKALNIGLVSEVVATDELIARGQQLAVELTEAAPLAYATVKEALHRGLESSMEAEWTANLPSQAVLISSEDFKEGLEAAKSRRKAVFKGF